MAATQSRLSAAGKPPPRLCIGSTSRHITRSAAAGMLRAARTLQERRIGYSVAYSRHTGVVRGEGPRGDWQIEHTGCAA